MIIKGAKSIAEYKIRKWIGTEIPNVQIASFEMNGNEATITDVAGDKLVLVYDKFNNTIHERGSEFE